MCLGPRASRLGQGAMITGCVRASAVCACKWEVRPHTPCVGDALIWWTGGGG